MPPRNSQVDTTWLFFYRLSFLLLLVQSLGVAALLISSQPTLLPLNRLYMLGLPILLAALWALLLYKSWINNPWLEAFDRRLRSWVSAAERWRLALLICFACIFVGSVILFAVHQGSFYFFAPPNNPDRTDTVMLVNHYYEKAYPLLILLQPVALLLVGFGLQMALIFPIAFFGGRSWHHKLSQHNLYTIGGIYGFFLLAWLLIGWTNIQLEPDYTFPGWYTLGAPILDSQFFLTLILGIVFVGAWLLHARLPKNRLTSIPLRLSSMRIDLIFGLVIWLLAAAHWLSIPTQVNWFVAPPRPPNNEYYPNSDALMYDSTAQSLLVGAGYKSGTLTYALRPLYAWFIALLHALFGQNFERVSAVQSAIFAVFPVLIYFLASQLHNRLTGLLAALLVILREGNAIQLADKITVSNSRLLMAEMPAAIGVALFLLLALAWFQRPQYNQIWSMLIGGVVAAASLIRIEVLALIPLFIAFTLIYTFRSPGKWLKHALLVIVGAILFLAPWVYHNWRTSGLVYLERPGERLTYFLVRSGAAPVAAAPGASAGTGVAPRPSFISLLRSNILNNHIQAVLYFPDAYRIIDSSIAFIGHRDRLRFFEVCCSRENYIDRFPFWNWVQWKGKIPNTAIVPILVNLLILSTGIASIWRRNGLVGLLPLLVAVTHYLISAIVRISGGRFVQIVDWIWIIYFSAGISTLILGSFAFMFRLQAPGSLVEQANLPEKSSASSYGTSSGNNRGGTLLLTGLVIFLLGASIPLTGWMIRPRYTQQTQQQWLEELFNFKFLQQQHPDILATLKSLPQIGPYLYQGRALYPRYHRAGQGELDISFTHSPKEFSGFSFFLVGPHNAGILLPVEKSPNVAFPDTSDVLVLGCQDQGFVHALLVYVRTTQTIMISSSFKDSFATCISGQKTGTTNMPAVSDYFSDVPFSIISP